MSTLTRANAVHLRIGGQPCGPLTQEQVKALMTHGTVSSSDTLSVDGGKTWVRVGKTSLRKYLPIKVRKKDSRSSSSGRSRSSSGKSSSSSSRSSSSSGRSSSSSGRSGSSSEKSGSTLEFSAVVKALPPDPSITRLPEKELKALPSPQLPPIPRLPPKNKHAARDRGWFMASGVVICMLAALCWMQFRPLGKDKAKAGDALGVVLTPLDAIDSGYAQQVVILIGAVGAVEGRADPAQLPGLAARCALVRLHDKANSTLCALPIRGPGDKAFPNSVYAVMDDAGQVTPSDAAVLCDDHGVRMDPGTPVRVTGVVHFENRDIQQKNPVIEVTKVELLEEAKPGL